MVSHSQFTLSHSQYQSHRSLPGSCECKKFFAWLFAIFSLQPKYDFGRGRGCLFYQYQSWKVVIFNFKHQFICGLKKKGLRMGEWTVASLHNQSYMYGNTSHFASRQNQRCLEPSPNCAYKETQNCSSLPKKWIYILIWTHFSVNAQSFAWCNFAEPGHSTSSSTSVLVLTQLTKSASLLLLVLDVIVKHELMKWFCHDSRARIHSSCSQNHQVITVWGVVRGLHQCMAFDHWYKSVKSVGCCCLWWESTPFLSHYFVLFLMVLECSGNWLSNVCGTVAVGCWEKQSPS